MKSTVVQKFLAAFALLLVGGVVALGAYTRLVDAGLGCPDWPTCYGHLWVPDSEHDIARANARFADTPVETDKTWPEQTHRIVASSLGLIILALFVIAYRQTGPTYQMECRVLALLLVAIIIALIKRVIFGRIFEPVLVAMLLCYLAILIRLGLRARADADRSAQQLALSALLSGMVIAQGLFGMWTVTLSLWPQVVSAHLLGGFATASVIAILFSRLWCPWLSFVWRSRSTLRLARSVLLVCVLQIALGAWLSSNYAALACPDLPLCQQRWWPDMDVSGGFNIFQHIGPNYLGGQLDNTARIAIHMFHRAGAMLLLALVLALCFLLYHKGSVANRRMACAMMAVTLVQIALGAANILYAIPLPVAVAHNLNAAILLVLIVLLNVHLHKAPERGQ